MLNWIKADAVASIALCSLVAKIPSAAKKSHYLSSYVNTITNLSASVFIQTLCNCALRKILNGSKLVAMKVLQMLYNGSGGYLIGFIALLISDIISAVVSFFHCI